MCFSIKTSKSNWLSQDVSVCRLFAVSKIARKKNSERKLPEVFMGEENYAYKGAESAAESDCEHSKQEIVQEQDELGFDYIFLRMPQISWYQVRIRINYHYL